MHHVMLCTWHGCQGTHHHTTPHRTPMGKVTQSCHVMQLVMPRPELHLQHHVEAAAPDQCSKVTVGQDRAARGAALT